MADLDFQIVGWLSGSGEEPLERETVASLRITAGPKEIPLTEVEDTLAHTVRPHINVSAYVLARWLLINWWRLRWEPQRDNPSFDWLRSHSMGAIGGSYAWPGLTIASDGEFVQLRLEAESSPDVSAVQSVLNESRQLFASKYLPYLPTEEELVRELTKERLLIEARTEVGDE